jgi:hypothetical protein
MFDKYLAKTARNNSKYRSDKSYVNEFINCKFGDFEQIIFLFNSPLSLCLSVSLHNKKRKINFL